jgi:hypothetical protein
MRRARVAAVVSVVAAVVAAACWMSGCGGGRPVWTVDRVEDDWAVVVDEAGHVRAVPLESLPSGAAEGDRIIEGQVDERDRREREAELAEMRARLSADDDGADFSLEPSP